MRLIVTGAEGFVGGHLLPALAARDHQVIGTFLARHPSIVGVEWIKVDLAVPESCAALIGHASPHAIIHLAAISHVPDVAADPGRAFSANVIGLVNLLRACEGREVIVVVASTGEVYGRVPPERLPIGESEPVAPLNLYGVSKACAEQVAWYFHRASGARTTVVRPFSQMGPGQADGFVCASFARQIARVILGKEPPVVQVGNLKVRRDFMDVRDMVRAYIIMAERYVGPGPFNVSHGQSVAIGHILETLLDLAGIPIEVRHDPSRVRPTDILDLVGDSSAFRALTGWRPEYSLRASLHDTLGYWIEAERGS